MKISAGFISLGLFLLLITPATAQSTAGAEQPTSRSWDTIVFHLPLRGIHDSVAIPGLGKVFAPTVSYTIAQSGNNLLVRKEVEHFVDDGARPVTDTSNWLRIRNEILLRWIDQHATIIKGESIAPGIYKLEAEGLTEYIERWGFHNDIFVIVFITSGEDVRKSINMLCLEKNARNGQTVNLNYDYNVSTKLYQLLQQLNSSIQQWDQQYTFPKKRRIT